MAGPRAHAQGRHRNRAPCAAPLRLRPLRRQFFPRPAPCFVQACTANVVDIVNVHAMEKPLRLTRKRLDTLESNFRARAQAPEEATRNHPADANSAHGM
eukprot:9098048-Pyramimonas_sp.AAC.1